MLKTSFWSRIDRFGRISFLRRVISSKVSGRRLTLDDDDFDFADDDLDDSALEPYRTLIGHAARAGWRMTPPSPPKALEEAQRKILDETLLTTRRKHTQATLLQMVQNQQGLRDRRERERRRVYQNKPYTKQDEEEDKATPMILYGPEQAIALVQHRLYPQFAMAKRVLAESSSLVPAFRPKRILDFGTGCGSASAAAWDIYGDSIEWFHLIDASKTMRETSEMLLKELVKKSKDDTDEQKVTVPSTRITLSAQMTTDSEGTFDLSLASFTLSELPDSSSILAAAALLYEKLRPGGLLVILEPGTPDGFANIRMVRNMLIDCCPDDAEDACQILAPCTHNGPCPMERNYGNRRERRAAKRERNVAIEDSDEPDDDGDDGDDDEELSSTRIGFCSFVQTMSGGTSRRRGEKLSYLVVRKRNDNNEEEDRDDWSSINLPDHLRRRLVVNTDQPMHTHLQNEAEELRTKYLSSEADELGLEFVRSAASRVSYGRIIEAPKKKKGHVLIDCCVEGRIERHKIPKSLNTVAPGLYGAARKSRWGGYWIPTEATEANDL